MKAREWLSSISRKQKGHTRSASHVLLHGVEHKSCASCASLKPLDSYSHGNKRAIDGLQSFCKTCVAAKRRKRDAA